MNAPGIRELTENLSALQKSGKAACISGMTGGATALECARLLKKNGGQLLLIVSSRERAKQMEEFLTFFAEERKIYVLPDEERSTFLYDAKSRVLSYRRLQCLSAALSGESCIFVAPVMAAVKGMPAVERFRDACIDLHQSDRVDYDDIRRNLLFTGYERTEVTEVRGQFSIRGGIIDVFPPDCEYPYRIDLFGDEIDALKIFDPLSQRSLRSVDRVRIIPADVPNPESEETASFLWDYMSDGRLIIADDWDRICEQRDLAERDWIAGVSGRADIAEAGVSAENADTADNVDTDEERAEPAEEMSVSTSKDGRTYGFRNSEYAKNMRRRPEYFADMYRLAEAMKRCGGVVTVPFRKTPMFVENIVFSASLNAETVPEFGGRMDHYAEELRRLIRENYHITIACVSGERVKNLSEFAGRMELNAGPDQIEYAEGFLPHGILLPETGEAYISDNDIFRFVKKKKKRRKEEEGGRSEPVRRPQRRRLCGS